MGIIQDENIGADVAALTAYRVADAMLAERDK